MTTSAPTPRPGATPPCRRTGRRPVALALGASVLLLAGCGTPPWKEGSAASPAAGTGTASASPTSASASPTAASASPSASPTPSMVNDLAEGSITHQLTAGAVQVTVRYWSTLPLAQWAPGVVKPLNLSLTGRLNAPASQKVYLDKATAVVTPYGAGGALDGPAPVVDKATSNPGYVIRNPYSYSQVFQLPAVSTDATSVTIMLTYDVLVQTAPGSKDYARQTASDQLTVPLS